MVYGRISALAALMFGFLSASALAGVTHTTSNLNLRAGPGTNYPVRAVIPAGAAIDVDSCGSAWCYSTWADHRGYTAHDYLRRHVTVVIPTIVHVTHVHYRAIY